MVAEVFAGLGAFKAMFDLAKGLKDLDDRATRNAVAIELQEKILAAQVQQAALIEHVSELEKEVARLKAWDAEKQNYEFVEVAPGVTAYAVKDSVRGTEPVHHLCTNCYANGTKSVLQKEHWQPMRASVLVCHGCGVVLYVSGQPHQDHKDLRPRGGR